MSKNMTRKGLAITAGSALALTGMVGTPAFGAGMTDQTYVSLAPSVGTDYAVLAGNGFTFSLDANEASTIAGANRNVKFLVSDPAEAIEPAPNSDARTLHTLTTADKIVFDKDDDTLEIDTVDNTLDIEVGDLVSFDAVIESTTGDGANFDGAVELVKTTSQYEVTDVSADGFGFTFVTDATEALAATTTDIPSEVLTVGGAIKVDREARDSDGSYVVDSGSANDPASDETLILKQGNETTSRTVSVIAWVDTNGNYEIDDTEFRSPERTITFVDPTKLGATISMTPTIGDTDLTAEIVTTPTLNGFQTLDNDVDFLNVAFTRQDSTATLYGLDDGYHDTGDSGETSNWNDTTKVWSVSVGTRVSSAYRVATAANGNSAGAWTGLTAPSDTDGVVDFTYDSDTEIVTVEKTSHNLRVGDKLEFANSGSADLDGSANAVTVASVISDDEFTFALPDAADTTFAADGDIDYDVVTYTASAITGDVSLVDRVFAGTYSATVHLNGSATSVTTKVGTLAASATEVRLSTTRSASVQGVSTTASTPDVAKVLAGTESVTVSATVLDKDDEPVGAGRPVEFTISGNSGTKVNDLSSGTFTKFTDANGVATFTVTADGESTDEVTVAANPEGQGDKASIKLDWETQDYGLWDVSVAEGQLTGGGTQDRTILEETSMTLDLLVADQWGTTPTVTDYRLKVEGQGVSEGFLTLDANGKAEVTITDSGVATSYSPVVTLQKLGATGKFADVTNGDYTFAMTVVDDPKVLIAADGSTLYSTENPLVAADLSAVVADAALVELDKRTESGVTPDYKTNVVLNGQIVDAASNADLDEALVTISGPNNILFSTNDDLVAKRGSITVRADSNGKFEVHLFSTTAQADTEITVTSLGASETVDVTFTGQSIGEATNLEIAAADFVSPASTFQVTAKLTDDFGNGVSTGTSDALKLTKTGAGITFGTLPDDTDVNGEATFNVLLGANDSGTITITASYDQNDDGDFTDSKDITVTKTITIGDAPADTKVNAGSFKGYVAVYAKGYEGQRLSAKIGNDWVIVPALASDFERVVDFTGAGVDIAVRIYIDRVLIDTINLTTK